MSSPESHGSQDEEFTLDVFLLGSDDAEAVTKSTRLLKLTRHHRTKDIDLWLPEETPVVSIDWVPEIVYETNDDSHSLRVVIRPNLTPHAQPQQEPSHISGGQAPPTPVTKNRAGPVPAPRPAPKDAAPLYEVTVQSREICVNGFRLSRPNFNSENEVAFDYIFANPNRRIDLTEIESATGRPLSKRLREIVRDLGFKKELRDMFFPGISKTAIEFRNPITRADFEARRLRPPQLEIRHTEKEGEMEGTRQNEG